MVRTEVFCRPAASFNNGLHGDRPNAARVAGRPVAIRRMDRVFAPTQSPWVGEAVLQSAQRGVGMLFGLDTTMNLLIAFPGYREIMHLPPAERAAQMRNSERRAHVLAETPLKVLVPGSSLPPMMDLVISQFDRLSMDMFPCVEVNGSMDYEPERSKSLGAIAKAKGVRPMEVMYDFLSEGDGNTSIYYPIFNYAPGDLSLVHDMLLYPKALSSLADGGAHVGTICDASTTTTMLAHWAAQRTVHGPGRPRRDCARHEGRPKVSVAVENRV